MKSKHRKLYLKPDPDLYDTEAVIGKILHIDEGWYTIIMIGVMWLPDIQKLEFNPERCVAIQVDGNTGEIKGGPMVNILLTTK